MRTNNREIEIIEISIKLALSVLMIYAIVLATNIHTPQMVMWLVLVELTVIGMGEARSAMRNRSGIFGFIVLIIRALMTGFCDFVGWCVDLVVLVLGKHLTE